MTNLTDKFTLFEEQSAAQHTEVVSFLSNIANALSTLNSRLVWDNGEDTFTQAQLAYLALLQLQEIKNSNDSIVTYLGDLTTTIADMAEDVSDIHSRLNEIRDNTLATAVALGIPSGDATTTALGRLSTIEGYLHAINLATGIPSGDATTTMLGRLATIENQTRCGCGPLPPTSPPCDNPYISDGVYFVPSIFIGGDVNVAAFPDPPPSGVTFGTEFGIGVDDTELQTATDWEGWQVYVESDAPNFQIGTLETARYPTGQWLELHGDNNLAFSVGSMYSITVYLCPPTTLPSECAFYSSSVVATPWGNTTLAVDWTDSPFTSTATGPTGTFGAPIFCTSPVGSWWVMTEDSDVFMNRSGGDSHFDVEGLTPSVWRQITSPTPYLHFYSNTAPFTIEMCPTEPE